MTERRETRRGLGLPLPGMPEWVIPAQPDNDERSPRVDDPTVEPETVEEKEQRLDNAFEAERRRVSRELYRIANELRALEVDPFFSAYQRTVYPVEAARMVVQLAGDTMANWRRL